jgi:hypothetical protein
MNNKKYDLKQIGIAFSPLWILFFFIFGLVIYGWAVGETLVFYAFGFVGMLILLPLLVPIANIFLILRIEDYHDFIGTLLGHSGDTHTLSLITFIGITYVILSFFIVIMTIFAILVMYWDRVETQLFAKLTPLVKKQETALEKTHQIRFINKAGREKIYNDTNYLMWFIVGLLIAIFLAVLFPKG